jgi:phosphoesterase RecJ-like protein
MINLYGSRKNALRAASLSYEETLKNIPWTKSRIISTIQLFYLKEIPLNYKYISIYHSKLKNKAERFFGSWGNAITASGLIYDDIKKHRSWSKPFLAEDGRLYSSQIEGLIANELFILKNNNRIINYIPRHLITPGKNLLCDFLIVLLNGANFWLEIDDGIKDIKDKIEFYDKAGFLYYVVSSHNNIKNIVERFQSWYSIPLMNSIITAHKNPDGDAISSVRAVYNYLILNNKKAVIKLIGDIPKNLEWILEGAEFSKKDPDWVENIIVLDCAPNEERTGWELPKAFPIYNIDHHINRIQFNNPDNCIHVISACSTASILYNRFGIKDDILTVGVYTDTLFTKSLTEVLQFLYHINIPEEKINLFLSRINSIPEKKLWDLLTESKIHHCRNGFVIAEIEEDAPDIIESFIQILSKMNEAICLIYGKNKNVKLRTSNPNLDVSQIAKIYFGGGHKFASMCNINGKVSEFKNKIISLNIPKIDIDGYGKKVK